MISDGLHAINVSTVLCRYSYVELNMSLNPSDVEESNKRDSRSLYPLLKKVTARISFQVPIAQGCTYFDWQGSNAVGMFNGKEVIHVAHRRVHVVKAYRTFLRRCRLI